MHYHRLMYMVPSSALDHFNILLPTKTNNMPLILLILSILGLLSFTKLTFSFFYYSYAFFLRPARDLKARYGSWAIVTGPTDGIGKAIAFELARKNLNLILVGRNPEKLEDVSTSIKDRYSNTEIKNVVMDLAGDTSAGLNKLREAVEGADVGVLVNNAGTVNKYAMWFHEGEAEKWMEIVKVNLESLTEVTRVVLHGMVERKRGAIVNIGSGSTVAVPSMPLLAVYAATKAYVQQLSRSLHVEYKNKGIDVQCQAPLYVDTKMVKKVKGYSFFKPSPDTFAREAVRWIGYEPLCVPFFPHFLQCCFAKLFPDFANNHVRLAANMRSMRAR